MFYVFFISTPFHFYSVIRHLIWWKTLTKGKWTTYHHIESPVIYDILYSRTIGPPLSIFLSKKNSANPYDTAKCYSVTLVHSSIDTKKRVNVFRLPLVMYLSKFKQMPATRSHDVSNNSRVTDKDKFFQ